MADEIDEICTVFDKFQKQEISKEDAREKLFSLVKKWKRKRKNNSRNPK